MGDLFLVSMEGYGTDACVYMKAVPVEASEVLPIFSTSSKRNLTMGPQVSFNNSTIVWINLSGS